jgi:hypothetical protein
MLDSSSARISKSDADAMQVTSILSASSCGCVCVSILQSEGRLTDLQKVRAISTDMKNYNRYFASMPARTCIL